MSSERQSPADAVRAAVAALGLTGGLKRPRGKRPPKGWKIVKVYIAYAPDDWEYTHGITCAGDGETFRSREAAVNAAWAEHESDKKRARGR